jgi:PEP-CTERM motif-containing protein
MMQHRALGMSLVLGALLMFNTSSHAVLIDSSDPYNFSWSYDTGSSTLTGHGSMSVYGFNLPVLVLGISLSNTSLIGGQGGERLTAFGFGIDPDPTWIGFLDLPDGGLTSATAASGALPANVDGVEVCAFAGNNCSGGGNGGIFAGNSDSFLVALLGDWGSSVNIEPIGVRYQTGYGSFEFPTTTTTTTTVPEPSSIALLGIGVLGLALARRKRAA